MLIIEDIGVLTQLPIEWIGGHLVFDELQFPDRKESPSVFHPAATDSDQVREFPCNFNFIH